jgi:hypothetical protein
VNGDRSFTQIGHSHKLSLSRTKQKQENRWLISTTSAIGKICFTFRVIEDKSLPETQSWAPSCRHVCIMSTVTGCVGRCRYLQNSEVCPCVVCIICGCCLSAGLCVYLREILHPPKKSAILEEEPLVSVQNLNQKVIRIESSSSVAGLEWPKWFQEVKVPRFLDNGRGWW